MKLQTLLTGVVDSSTVVCVGTLEYREELFSVLTVTKAVLQLIKANLTVAIAIKRLEDLFELSNVVGIRLHSDRHQGYLLELLAFAELFDVAHVKFLGNGSSLLGGLMDVVPHPGVLQSLSGSHAPLRPRDELVDQVLGLIGDVVPLLAIVVKDAARDHLQDFLVIVAVEGRVAAQQDVQHAAGRPHIARHVVVAGQDFGRDVVGRACSCLHALQAAAIENLRQAEVDDLQV